MADVDAVIVAFWKNELVKSLLDLFHRHGRAAAGSGPGSGDGTAICREDHGAGMVRVAPLICPDRFNQDKHNNIPLGMVILIRSHFHGSPSSVIVMLIIDRISRIFTIQFRYIFRKPLCRLNIFHYGSNRP